jgi:hypothetical protein
MRAREAREVPDPDGPPSPPSVVDQTIGMDGIVRPTMRDDD